MAGYTRHATVRDRFVRATGVNQGYTTASVIVRDQASGAMLLHLLIDAGLGVVDSLIGSRADLGGERLDAVFITHAHYDHVTELPRLAEGVRGAHLARGDRAYRLPVYCTEPVARQAFGPTGAFPFIAGDTRVTSIAHYPLLPCEPIRFAIPGGETLTITPISVDHGPSAPGATIYVVQALGRKVIFGWDILQIVEEPDVPTDAQRERFVAALPRRHAELVHDADVLFLDSTTWNPMPSLGHLSILEGLALARRWRPRRTYWIHYGAWERPGQAPLNPLVELPGIEVARALTDPELHWLAGRVSGLLDLDIRVAYAGMTLGMIDAWPEAYPPRFI
jgi:phosphoribosyl 1,2-cyclic phosphodiesterase